MSNLTPWPAIRTCWCALLALVLIVDSSALADLVPASGNSSGPSAGDFTYLGDEPTPMNPFGSQTKWGPGENTGSTHPFISPAGPMTPGGASWSVMPVGTVAVATSDPHLGTGTTLGVNTYAGGLISGAGAGNELTIFAAALDVWASASGFVNLGMKADSGDPIGTFEPGPGNTLFGDIRIGAYTFDGANGTLAHGFQPELALGGDIHFDTAETWIDVEAGGMGGYDLFSVALHEFGHALGLGHSADTSAIMYPFIGLNVSNRVLGTDDIAGITALYGVAAVPEPSSFLFLGLVSVGVLVLNRMKKQAVLSVDLPRTDVCRHRDS